MARVNQVLNYPALTYSDVSHFFDQAIAELNTNLRIALPSVSEMRSDHTFNVTEQESLVRLNTYAELTDLLPHFYTVEELKVYGKNYQYAYVCDNYRLNRKFYKRNVDKWEEVDALYGIYLSPEGDFSTYNAVTTAIDAAHWVPVENTHVTEFDLTDYMPIDWWILFVIPYVCFKFSVRNGDSGELFVDEYIQGYQQLQSSYNVPNTVVLSSVAGRPAYKSLVEQNLANLNTAVFTRAISEDMRVGNGIASVYGGFYETGGWGI